MKNQLSFAAAAALLFLNACVSPPPVSTSPVRSAVPEKPVASAVPTEPVRTAMLKPADWNALTGWTEDDIQPAWDAFLRSCTVLKNQPLWQDTCT
ncbi:MAG TPA: transglycosylase, partial [Nitrosospira sp.]